MNASEVTRAMNGRWYGSYGMVCCPVHQDRSPSLKLADGSKGVVVHCFAGCDWRDVREEMALTGLVEKWSRGTNRTSTAFQSRRPGFHISRSKAKLEFARKIWEAATAPQYTLAERYLNQRGITIALPDCVRFHPGLRHPEVDDLLPAVVFAYSNLAGEFDGIQRVFLNPVTAEKAPVSQPKLSLGTCAGGMIRFGNPSEPDNNSPNYGELALCEGPEDALSILQLYGLPVWCAGAGEKMASANIPEPLEALHIYRDAGEIGFKYAKKALLAHAAKTIEFDGSSTARIIEPPEGHEDQNDYLRSLS